MKKKSNFKIGGYIKPYLWLIITYVLLMVGSNVLTFFVTFKAADTLTFIGDQAWNKALIAALVLGACAGGNNIITYLASITYNYISQKCSYSVMINLADRVYLLSSKAYANTGTGVIVQRIVNDPRSMIASLQGALSNLLQLINTIVVVVYLMTLNIWVGLVVFGGIVILTIIETLRGKVYKKQKAKNAKLADKVYSLTDEIVKSEKDVKSLNLEPKLKEMSREKYGELRRSTLRQQQTDTSFDCGRRFLATIIVSSILVVSVVLARDFNLAVQTVMFVFMYRMNISMLASHWGGFAQNIYDFKVYKNRIGDLFDEDVFPVQQFGQTKLENCHGDIEFKDVSFSYKDEINAKKVLDGLSFKIENNKTVAFVGISGSGKTTILNLIGKMYECDDGVISIDGQDIKSLDKNSIRDNIALVNQFPYIFDLSIRQNLLMVKPDASEEDIQDVIEKACLKEFIDSLPNGLETVVGESGVKLSGGQRQRIAIARALLKNSRIILFDESTSSLDNLAQEHIKQSIANLSGEKTIVIVAHRLSTIVNADKIFFLENGKITDSGTFSQLQERNNKFKTMFMAEEFLN